MTQAPLGRKAYPVTQAPLGRKGRKVIRVILAAVVMWTAMQSKCRSRV